MLSLDLGLIIIIIITVGLFKIKFKATNCYHKIVKQIVYKNFFEGIDTNQIALFSNLILLICML